MKPKILSDEQIGAVIDSSDGEHEEYWIPDNSFVNIAQAQLDADVLFYEPLIQQAKSEVAREAQELFPEHICPRHLECWAEQLTRDWGYSSELTVFLKSVAAKWRLFQSKYGGQK